MPAARTPGRRPGASTTRDDLLTAAREEFAAAGFERATLRSIAARAGVDPAMVKHHFGSKQGLLAAAVQLPFDPGELVEQVFAGPRDQLGTRLAMTFLSMWDDAGGGAAMTAIRSAMQSEEACQRMHDFLIHGVMQRGFTAFTGWTPEARWRASLIASQLIGLLTARYILRFEPLASASREQVARVVGANLQYYLTGDVGDLPAAPASSLTPGADDD